MMKRLVDIVVMRKQEDVSLTKRRNDYAIKRDLLAAENNSAISRRQVSENDDLIRCMKCGKDLTTEKSSLGNLMCPDCGQILRP